MSEKQERPHRSYEELSLGWSKRISGQLDEQNKLLKSIDKSAILSGPTLCIGCGVFIGSFFAVIVLGIVLFVVLSGGDPAATLPE